jgi:hypothetical protein
MMKEARMSPTLPLWIAGKPRVTASRFERACWQMRCNKGPCRYAVVSRTGDTI